MRIEQTQWTPTAGWNCPASLSDAGLVLVFGGTDRLTGDRIAELRKRHPGAILFGGSTAGEIVGVNVSEDTIVATAIRFEHTRLCLVSQAVTGAEASHAAGRELAQQLPGDGLVHVLVLTTGLDVNGTELVDGIKSGLPEGVEVTGGLTGDGNRFQRTLVIADREPEEHRVAAVGFYGQRLKVGHGCLGGWDPFGPDRLITRSKGNVLYELDGRSALELYKQYLGEHAADLPASALLFPLALHREGEADVELVRAIMSVNEEEQSMTFAGDVPEGRYARMMRANFDRLVEGASGAARLAQASMVGNGIQFALLISCVARKLVLAQRIEEEVEGVRDILGPEAVLAGFYSYGEISPYTPSARCELHNQTMTITTFCEV